MKRADVNDPFLIKALGSSDEGIGSENWNDLWIITVVIQDTFNGDFCFISGIAIKDALKSGHHCLA